MNINELKEGGIYIAYRDDIDDGIIFNHIHIKNIFTYSKIGKTNVICRNFSYDPRYKYVEPTLEQKHWFNMCVIEDKFISYDDAMKSFVKEFVLPEKWCIKGTICKTVQKYFLTYKNNKLDDLVIDPSYETWYFHSNPVVYEMYASSYKHNNYTEITFDQFKQYVLKEVVIEEVKLPYEILVKHNEDIIEVANEEGNVFKIGDRVKSLKRQYPSTITRFIKGNTAINAITSNFIKGISIDKIEHYIEPKVKHLVITNSHIDQLKLHNQGIDAVVIQPEESLLDKAKRLYPIGTKFIPTNTNNERIIITGLFKNNGSGGINEYSDYGILVKTKNDYHCVYTNGQWAEIISKPEVDNSKYEILSLSYYFENEPIEIYNITEKLTNNGYYKFYNNKNGYVDLSSIFYPKDKYDKKVQIHSVKQLSTGDIFTVGDKAKTIDSKNNHIIKSIKINQKSIDYNTKDGIDRIWLTWSNNEGGNWLESSELIK